LIPHQHIDFFAFYGKVIVLGDGFEKNWEVLGRVDGKEAS